MLHLIIGYVMFFIKVSVSVLFSAFGSCIDILNTAEQSCQDRKKPLRLANNFWMISVYQVTVAAPAPLLHLAYIPNLKRVCYLRLE